MNVFDIVGPVMIGPSSSHTAGAVRIGYVAGLVEIPCIKRNASGAANAFAAAELALAGIKSAIPADETIIAMKNVGDSMHTSLKETGEGGLAATPTGKRIFQQLFGTDGAKDGQEN